MKTNRGFLVDTFTGKKSTGKIDRIKQKAILNTDFIYTNITYNFLKKWLPLKMKKKTGAMIILKNKMYVKRLKIVGRRYASLEFFFNHTIK